MQTDVLILLLRLAMVVLLYLFLFALWSAIRRDLGASPRSVPSRARPALARDRLVILHPGSSPLPVGAEFGLAGPTGMGRGASNEIVVDDEFASVHHARLAPRRGAWLLSDLGSTNGTLLNGRKLQEDAEVLPGDVIGVGGARLRLVRGERG